MNETDKLIEEQLKTLPQNLQRAIKDVQWKTMVQEVGRQNNLTAEQSNSLEQETMFIIYEFENPVDYPNNIIRELGISEKMAYAIVESVANKIFDPILKKSDEYGRDTSPVSVPEIPPTNLPMVEKGEAVHDVAPATSEVGSKKREVSSKPEQAKVSLPDYRYPGGQDPYREPTK